MGAKLSSADDSSVLATPEQFASVIEAPSSSGLHHRPHHHHHHHAHRHHHRHLSPSVGTAATSSTSSSAASASAGPGSAECSSAGRNRTRSHGGVTHHRGLRSLVADDDDSDDDDDEERTVFDRPRSRSLVPGGSALPLQLFTFQGNLYPFLKFEFQKFCLTLK